MAATYTFELNSNGRIINASKNMCKFFGINESGFGFHYIQSFTKNPLQSFIELQGTGEFRLRNPRRRSYLVKITRLESEGYSYHIEGFRTHGRC